MHQLTHNQILHREYLRSPVWAKKREEALALYGCTCNRCKAHGTDVHHRTYERWGGNERISDLEILCRDCHSAHHDAERFIGKQSSKKRRGIHRRAIHGRLKKKHLDILSKEFPDVGAGLFSAITYWRDDIANRAAELLGCNYIHGKTKRAEMNLKRCSSHRNKYVSQPVRNEKFVNIYDESYWKKVASLKELCFVASS